MKWIALQEDNELRRNQKLYKSELRLNEVQSAVYLSLLLQVARVTGGRGNWYVAVRSVAHALVLLIPVFVKLLCQWTR